MLTRCYHFLVLRPALLVTRTPTFLRMVAISLCHYTNPLRPNMVPSLQCHLITPGKTHTILGPPHSDLATRKTHHIFYWVYKWLAHRLAHQLASFTNLRNFISFHLTLRPRTKLFFYASNLETHFQTFKTLTS